MMECTLPLNVGQGILLRLFSALQPALQICQLSIQKLPVAAGLHQLPFRLHAAHTFECQVVSFVEDLADQDHS